MFTYGVPIDGQENGLSVVTKTKEKNVIYERFIILIDFRTYTWKRKKDKDGKHTLPCVKLACLCFHGLHHLFLLR
jgi:hypothetical protein